MIDELGCAQVSMNLLDFATTPIWRAWDEVVRLAAEHLRDRIADEDQLGLGAYRGDGGIEGRLTIHPPLVGARGRFDGRVA